MIAIADYDALLTAIYEAGAGRATLAGMLAAIAETFDSVSAGFLVYDEPGRQVTHAIAAPMRALPADWQRRLGDMNDEPALRILARIPLREPRRFTDIVPRSRLRSAAWFRRQAMLTGAGYGIAVDLDLGGLRVRMFAMRAADATDFASPALDLLGRVARHVERGWAGAAHRLAPHRLGPDTGSFVYREAAVVGAVRGDRSPAGRLARRYGLTPAEARVALAAAEGQARAVTAAALGVSINSLKTHLRRVHAKLGVVRAAELVRLVADETGPRHPEG